jgi:hypothetical protein
MKGTKLSFLRDILSDKKLHLKQNEVIRLEIPSYQELSVKNLYDDAMRDPALAKYLPSKEQLSNKLPEREFFFGVMCTLKKQYMTDIITEAQAKRYKIQDGDQPQDSIVLTEAWMLELQKHPYHSSKSLFVTFVERAGTGIFLMKEKAKLVKQQRERKVHQIGKRLHPEEAKGDDMQDDVNEAEKKKKLGSGKAQVI